MAADFNRDAHVLLALSGELRTGIHGSTRGVGTFHGKSDVLLLKQSWYNQDVFWKEMHGDVSVFLQLLLENQDVVFTVH